MRKVSHAYILEVTSYNCLDIHASRLTSTQKTVLYVTEEGRGRTINRWIDNITDWTGLNFVHGDTKTDARQISVDEERK